MERGRIRRQERNDRVLVVVQENAASLLKVARAHSLCADDAFDAYQRAIEIFLLRVEEVDFTTAGPWLRTIVKHEAKALRAARQRVIGVDFDEWGSLEGDGEERALEFDRVTRAAEALQHCKRDEVTALVLKAEGHSYQDICVSTGWSYTKVNRCLAEGRASFMKRYAAIECGDECDRIAPLLSAMVDGEATALQLAEARPHLRNCPGCRATLRELHEAQPVIHAVVPPIVLLGGGVTVPDTGWLTGLADEAAVRMQSMIEALSGAKVAAVAASAAAVAGGGAVAVQQQVERTAPRAVAIATATPTPKATPQPTVVAARVAEEPVARATPAPRARVSRPRRITRPVATAARRDFSFEAPARMAGPKAKTATATSSDSFGFER